MIVLAYHGSQRTKFHAARWTCWSFTPFYLVSCIWPDAISHWIWQRNSMKCSKPWKMCDWDPGNDRQAFGEEGMSCTHVFEWRAPFLADRKRRDRWRAKSRACLSFSMTSRGLFTKNSSWQSKQSVLHSAVIFYGDCVKMRKDFTPNFGNKRTGCCIMTVHYLTLPFSSSNFFTKKNMTVIPHPPSISVFPVEDKSERLTFWHNWDDQGRIVGGVEHPHRTRLPGCI
jgi:hypothetical protein